MTTRSLFPLFFLALVLFGPPLRADQKSRAALASQLLEIAYTPDSLRDSFSGFLKPALDAMQRAGMPEAARTEVRGAFTQWFDEQIKWGEIKPKLVDIYATDFTEEELKALLAFYQQPAGQKVMARLPLVLQDAAVVGQQYYLSKQDSLNARLAPIVEKYKK